MTAVFGQEDWTTVKVHHKLTTQNHTTFQYFLKQEVVDWLVNNRIFDYQGMMRWEPAPSTLGWFTMYFKHEKHAILFKLRWS